MYFPVTFSKFEELVAHKVQFQNISVTLKRSLVPTCSRSLFPAPGCHESTFCLDLLFQTFQINGIRQYMVFGISLLSLSTGGVFLRFLQFVVCISTLFPSTVE